MTRSCVSGGGSWKAVAAAFALGVNLRHVMYSGEFGHGRPKDGFSGLIEM